jgi:hypothetical protein
MLPRLLYLVTVRGAGGCCLFIVETTLLLLPILDEPAARTRMNERETSPIRNIFLLEKIRAAEVSSQ